MSPHDALRAELKTLLVESLHLEGTDPASIDDDQALFDGALGLDSVDALELVVALERRYGVRIESERIDREAFSSIAKLAELVESLRAGGEAKSPGDASPN